MIVQVSEFYAEMFKDIPAEIVLLMGFETMLSSGLVKAEQKMAIYDMFADKLNKAEDLEVDFDWDKALSSEE